ncbi:MAG: hypothetical protein JW395_2887 [Nitrospira sp.]|nr:hypothetical protein [Nitrospira sp.]
MIVVHNDLLSRGYVERVDRSIGTDEQRPDPRHLHHKEAFAREHPFGQVLQRRGDIDPIGAGKIAFLLQDVRDRAIHFDAGDVSRCAGRQEDGAGTTASGEGLDEEAFTCQHAPDTAHDAALEFAFQVYGGVHRHHCARFRPEHFSRLKLHSQHGKSAAVQQFMSALLR